MNKNRSKSVNTAETNLHLPTVVLSFYDCSNQIYFKRLKASGCYTYHQFHIQMSSSPPHNIFMPFV